jgi:cytochrome c oxidase assembly protein subunit 15
LIEAGIGAGLVLFELVADNDSLSRATIIGVHLLNSMLLLASMVLTPWSFYFKIQRVELPPRREIISAASLILLMLLVGATGAVTALGNTLFPSTVLLDGIRDDFASTSHILIRLRIIHPILACVLALFIAKYSYERMCRYPNGDLVNSISKYLIGFTGLQVTMGVANVVLLAPTWLQMLHLIGADLCWMLLIVLIGHQYAFSKQSSKASGEDVQTSTIEERVTSNG